jgi:hypothetical protein
MRTDLRLAQQEVLQYMVSANGSVLSMPSWMLADVLFRFTYRGKTVAEFFDRGRSGKFKISHNTWLHYSPEEIVVRFHGNTIACWNPDSSTAVLLDAGWHTRTTADRLQKLLPAELQDRIRVSYANGKPTFERVEQ